jgi:hypothetical protein
MEQKLATGPAAVLWEWAPAPQTTAKFDNRAYVMAAHAGWADGMNRPIKAVGEVEAQTLPGGFYTVEHQNTRG